jgi:hypothetical protein
MVREITLGREGPSAFSPGHRRFVVLYLRPSIGRMDFHAPLWDLLVGRFEGPMSFRLIVQPLMAVAFGIHAGLGDARGNRTPYVKAMLEGSPEQRHRLERDAWRDIGKVFILAIILDCIYQLKVFGWIYPVQAGLVAMILAVIPYVLVRGTLARLLERRHVRD